MSNERKHHTPEEKVAILRLHLIDSVASSTLGDEHLLHPRSFAAGSGSSAAAFGPAPLTDEQVEARERRIVYLETRLRKNDGVVAELMEAHVALNSKSLGTPSGHPTKRDFWYGFGTAKENRSAVRLQVPAEQVLVVSGKTFDLRTSCFCGNRSTPLLSCLIIRS
jgi:hypothetical protein